MNLQGKYVTATTQEECEAVLQKAKEKGFNFPELILKAMYPYIENNYTIYILFEGNNEVTWCVNNVYTMYFQQIDLETLLSL